MAKLRGLLKFTGSVGDLNAYKSDGEYVLREKGGVPKERIMTDPLFQRTRENFSEFGRAGKHGMVLRHAFSPLLARVTDAHVSNRMQMRVLKAMQTDQTNRRGSRDIINANLELLKGFEFNKHSSFGQVFMGHLAAKINRGEAQATVSIPQFRPMKVLNAPAEATHFRFIAGCAEVDFSKSRWELSTGNTQLFPFTNEHVECNLTLAVPQGSILPLFLAIKIAFYQEVNGVMYSLLRKQCNAVTIVDVDF